MPRNATFKTWFIAITQKGPGLVSIQKDRNPDISCQILPLARKAFPRNFKRTAVRWPSPKVFLLRKDALGFFALAECALGGAYPGSSEAAPCPATVQPMSYPEHVG